MPHVITTNDFQIDFCRFDSLLSISYGHIVFLPNTESSKELDVISEFGFKVPFTKHVHVGIVV